MKFINNKKRILTGIIFASILSTNLGIASTQAASQKMYGDVNNDLKVDNMDLTMFCQYMVKDISFDVETMYIADLNENGAVGIDDLALLKQYIMGDKIPKIGTYKETTQTEVTTEPITTSVTTTNETTVTTEASITTVTEVPVTTVTEVPTIEAKTITLNGASIDKTGTGIDINGSVATIKEPGVYVITGTLNDGQIIVNVDKTTYPDGEVELSLEGATINCSNNSAIFIESVDKECAISVKKGTVNTVSDGTSYTNADGDSGTIYSKDDLKIKGKGDLVVKGNYTDGIVSKDSIKLFNGNIEVTAVDDGIRGKDSVKIGDTDDTDFSALKVDVTSSSGDGIKTTNETDVDSGKVIINGGTVVIKSFTDAIDAAQSIKIDGGEVDIYTNKGSTGGSIASTVTSAKGLKAVKLIEINNGTIKIDSTDDSIHSNTDLIVNGGNVTMATTDDAIHADNSITINNGNINITKSYEGIEAYLIDVKGGNIKLVSSDDGFNAAGGDGSGTQNNTGFFQGGMSTSTGTLNISGGYCYVQANGDGVDSNGNLTISGGTVIVCGPSAGGNGIFDIGDGGTYKFTVNGGTIFGIGTSSMFVSPTSNNSYLSTAITLQSGNILTIADSTGRVLSALKVPSSLNMNGALVYASPSFAAGTYSVYSGGTYTGTLDENGYGVGGTVSGGTLVNSPISSGGMGPR
jgi:hypothetical protein